MSGRIPGVGVGMGVEVGVGVVAWLVEGWLPGRAEVNVNLVEGDLPPAEPGVPPVVGEVPARGEVEVLVLAQGEAPVRITRAAGLWAEAGWCGTPATPCATTSG